MSRRGAVPTGVLSSGGGISFDPSDHGSALQLWRKADDGITLAGSEITAWSDQVAGGDSSIPVSDRLTLIDPAQNSLPAVRDGSAAATLVAPDSNLDDFWAGGGGMLILAGELRDSSINGVILSRGFSNDDPGETGWNFKTQGAPNFSLRLQHNFSSSNFIASSTQNIAEGTPFIATIVWDGDSGSTPIIRINGVDNFNQATGGSGAIRNSNPAMYHLAKATLNGSNARMELYEYYFVKPAPVSFTADEGYLNIKWAIF